MTSALTKIDVAIAGVRNRSIIVRAFESLGCVPVGDSGARVTLLVGKAAVDKALGPDWREEITCLRKFGNQRAQRRAAWEPWCVSLDPDEDGNPRWAVTCIHPDRVRKSRWALWPSLLAAVRHAVWLSRGQAVFGTGVVFQAPVQWIRAVKDRTRESQEPVWLGLDLEGDGELVTEVGLSAAGHTLSCQWTRAAKEVTKEAVGLADLVVGHNIVGYDAPALEGEGVHIPREKVFDTMVAFSLLYPHHLKRLGASAPLLIPTRPWKHLDQSDMEAYNAMDAAVIVPMAAALTLGLQKYGMERLFWEIEMPWAWLVSSHKEVWTHEGRVEVRYRPKTTGGPYSSLTGEFEPQPSLSGLVAPPGKKLHFRRLSIGPATLAGALGGGNIGPGETMAHEIVLHLQGYGPVQINKKLKEMGEATTPGIKARLADWDRRHPWFPRWVERVGSQAIRMGYVVNPFGRRAWTRDRGQAVRFVVASTMADILKKFAVENEDGFYAASPPALIFTVPPKTTTLDFPEIAPGFSVGLEDYEKA